jgi:hypothetical protein
MDTDLLVKRFLDAEVFVPFLIAASIVVGIAIQSIRACIQTFARERSRREIAAYIAEGSLSPEQGERLMRAGNRSDS